MYASNTVHEIYSVNIVLEAIYANCFIQHDLISTFINMGTF